jgi:hypothetical protein
MKVQQYIKKLNNTELGKGNTHECYVLVSSKVPMMNEFFDDQNLRPNFQLISQNSNSINSIHITKGRELRINGLGEYYSNNNANAGDEIMFERRDINGMSSFFIDFKAKNNTITFQRNAKGFEALNIDRLNDKLVNNSCILQCEYNNSACQLTIQFKESAKKRSDSPDLTDFYQILVNGIDIINDYRNNDYLELEELGANSAFKKVNVWQKYEFNY